MELKDLIIDDSERGIFRVHRSTMTSSQILELERERIFDRCWLYLGHESEVEKPGDFKRRTVAGRPLFWVRGSDGKVRVFHNTCTHWGANVCRVDEGNAETFQCFYHAWAFNNKGELISQPDSEAYPEGFDRTEMGLASPPRLDNYRGFYFVSFNPDVADLHSYLAEAKEYIDLILDQSEEGWRVVPGVQKYSVRANWKLFSKNSLDSYHAPLLHASFFRFAQSLGPGDPPPPAPEKFASDDGRALPLGNGHAVDILTGRGGGTRPIAHWHPVFGEETREEIHRIRERLVERFGEEQAYFMCNTSRLMLIYPNFALHDISAISLRYFEPVAPDLMELTVQTLAPKGESAELLNRRLENFLSFLGPAGFAHPDDVEALESAQLGYTAGGPEWIDVSKGMHRRDNTSMDEVHIRSFWRQWHANVLGLAQAERVDDLVAVR